MAAARRDDNRRKAAERERAPAIKSFWIQSFFGIAMVLLMAAIILVYLWVARSDQDGRRQIASGTSVLAKSVGAEVARVRGLVDALRGDPELRAAIQSRSPEQLRARERALLDRLPGAMGVHLFPPEQTSSEEATPYSETGIPYMSYAGLDLARQAAQERAVTLVEVHKIGQPDMHLAIAAPVLSPAGDQAAWVVHVALPMSLLPSPAGVVGDRGVVLYQQVVGDTAATLGATTEETHDEPDHADAIPGTRLRVAGWLRNPGRLDPWLLGEVLGIYLVVLGLTGLALWLGFSAMHRALALDFKGLIALIDDSLNRRPVRKIKTHVAEAHVVHQKVYDFLHGIQPTRAPLRGVAAEQHPQQQTPVPDPLDDGLGPTTHLSESSIEVEEIDLPEDFDPYASQSLPIPQPIGRNPLADFDAFEEMAPPPRSGDAVAVPAEIFRASDIRGIADRQLSQDTIRSIGRALGSEAAARGEHAVVIGRDCRASSPALAAALAEGIRAAGAEAVDLGVVPTPLVYFACCHPEPLTGAMVTASRNPAEYNGVKTILSGVCADRDAIQALYQRIRTGSLSSGNGGYSTQDALAPYLDYVGRDLTLARSLKIAVDCGNATASVVAPRLFREIGCEVIELNCDMDAGLGERMPDPAQPDATRDLGDLVLAQKADLGLAFDADGDRLGVVDSQGRFVAADRVLMLLATDILARHPGSDIVYDVMCSRHLAEEIRRAGGRPVMAPSEHAALKARLRETGAPIAGGHSGHIVYKERWFGFDDAIYAGARLLEVLSLDPRPTQEIFAALPGGIATPELTLPLPEGESARVMSAVMQLADRLDGVDVIRIDGLRAEFERGWGLVRASGTLPRLVFRFEGDDAEALEKIQTLFRRIMGKAAADLSLPF